MRKFLFLSFILNLSFIIVLLMILSPNIVEVEATNTGPSNIRCLSRGGLIFEGQSDGNLEEAEGGSLTFTSKGKKVIITNYHTSQVSCAMVGLGGE